MKNLFVLFLALLSFILAFYFSPGLLATALLQSSLLLFVFSFYPSLKEFKEKLDLRLNFSIKGYVITLVFSFLTVLVINVVLYFLGLNDSSLVFDKISSFPILFLIGAIIIIPFIEELFFRGLLYNLIGPLFSSIIFGLAHYQYGSISEIIDAFLIGYIFCYSRKKYGLLIPIAAHITINLVSILAVYFLKSSF